jgi:hypothetical protein
MGCLEGSDVPVLYIGRMVPKGDVSLIRSWVVCDRSCFSSIAVFVFIRGVAYFRFLCGSKLRLTMTM